MGFGRQRGGNIAARRSQIMPSVSTKNLASETSVEPPEVIDSHEDSIRSMAPRPSSFKKFWAARLNSRCLFPGRPTIISKRRRLEHDGLICVAQNCAPLGGFGQTGSDVSY
jgi:hypothetical protein